MSRKRFKELFAFSQWWGSWSPSILGGWTKAHKRFQMVKNKSQTPPQNPTIFRSLFKTFRWFHLHLFIYTRELVPRKLIRMKTHPFPCINLDFCKASLQAAQGEEKNLQTTQTHFECCPAFLQPSHLPSSSHPFRPIMLFPANHLRWRAVASPWSPSSLFYSIARCQLKGLYYA